ncbi:LemA family protein [compost metagenome]
MEATLIIGGIALLLIIYYYNKLIRRKNEVANATGSIDAMLKNRYDLIPNLVDTVKAYMSYETEVLSKLTAMRIKAIASDTSEDDKMKLNTEISGALKQVMIAVENYPDLKTSSNFLQLQESWKDVEDRISASRRFYNNAVTDYNDAIKTFPGNIFAGLMGYKTKAVFEITPAEAQNLSAKNLLSN